MFECFDLISTDHEPLKTSAHDAAPDSSPHFFISLTLEDLGVGKCHASKGTPGFSGRRGEQEENDEGKGFRRVV